MIGRDQFNAMTESGHPPYPKSLSTSTVRREGYVSSRKPSDVVLGDIHIKEQEFQSRNLTFSSDGLSPSAPYPHVPYEALPVVDEDLP